MAGQPSIKGVRIRTVNLVMLFLSLVLFIIVLYFTIKIAGEYEKSVAATRHYINWEKAAHSIHIGSDYLTEEARLFTQTHDKRHADNYFKELYSTRSREHALESLGKNNGVDTHQNELRRAFDLSNKLTRHEIYAMRLVLEGTGQDLSQYPEAIRSTPLDEEDTLLPPDKKIEKGRAMMFNPKYIDTKAKIMEALGHVLDHNLTQARDIQKVQSDRLGKMLQHQRVVLVALCLLNILTFAMIIVLIVKPLQIYLRCIRNDKMLELVGAYEFKHLALTYNDIFAIKEHKDRMLKHKAEHDPLTGLMNRRAFDDLREILRASPKSVGLMLVDVDKFKDINDTYGHVVGDKMLCKVAGLLKGAFRADDFCVRLGGDEFAVVLQGITPDLETIVCEKVRAINHTLMNPDDSLPKESISVGVAFSKSGFPDNLYTRADEALYDVKEHGRSGCAFYHHLQKTSQENTTGMNSN